MRKVGAEWDLFLWRSGLGFFRVNLWIGNLCDYAFVAIN